MDPGPPRGVDIPGYVLLFQLRLTRCEGSGGESRVYEPNRVRWGYTFWMSKAQGGSDWDVGNGLCCDRGVKMGGVEMEK